MSKYSFLKTFINNHARPAKNWFGEVKVQEILKSEDKIGYRFPAELKEFWLEVGYGGLHESYNGTYAFDYANTFLRPSQIASIIFGEEDAPMILPYREDFVHEGDIPFFEVADSSDYLFMKRDSDKIYYLGVDEVASNFEEFIHKLYYESPAFYLWVEKEDQDPYRVKK